MEQRITERVPLLAENGQLSAKGYATKMNVIYNRDHVKSFPLRLKEWNFYQLIKDHYSLQLTIGHVSYVCSVGATLIDLDTGKRWEIGSMKLLHVPKLDADPEQDSVVTYWDRKLSMTFEVKGGKRILKVYAGAGQGKQKYQNVEIYLELPNDPDNEKMVIATPFEKPTQFYLNYKENYYEAAGSVRFDDLTVDFTGATGVLDWGRGVWPYSHEWFWGNMSAHIDGEPFGFNIGWGFGDLSHATENMYFYKKKAYKVGELIVERDEQDYRKPWKLRDREGKLSLVFTPYYDNYTENRLVVVNTHCDQVYGYFDGTVETEDGKKEFRKLFAFIEHAVNRW